MRRKREGDSSLFAAKWCIVEEVAECVFGNKVSRFSFQSVHHAVFQICQAKHGEMLLDSLKGFFVLQCRTIAQALLATDRDFFLEEIVIAWEAFACSLQRVDVLLLYFENYLSATHRPSVLEIGEQIFSEHVLKDAEIEQRILASVRESIDSMDKWDVLRQYSKILCCVDRGAHYPALECAYVDVIRKRCSEVAARRSEVDTVEEYLLWANTTIASQEEQIANLLFPASVACLRQTLLDDLIQAFEKYLLFSPTGCVAMLSRWYFKGIDELIRAFHQRDNLTAIVDVLTVEVKKMTSAILAEDATGRDTPSSTTAIVEGILALLQNCETLASLIPRVGKSAVETSAVLKGMHDVLNGSTAFPEKLALYYDIQIRQTGVQCIKGLADNVLNLFRILRDKDAFEISCRNHLAARIMHAKPDGLAAEKYFIDRMREEYGAAAVSRLEKMIADVQDAASLQERFKTQMADSHYVLPLDFRVSVLTAGFWPQYSTLSFNPPEPMKMCAAIFHKFYTSRHNGRILTFQLSLGAVGFCFRHNGKVHAVTAPTPFYSILHSLNADDVVTVNDVSVSSGIPRADLAAQITTVGQSGLLVTVAGGGGYKFNHQFSTAATKIRIGAGHLKIAKETSLNPSGRTSEEVAHAMGLDSAIVKVLKDTKIIDHETLCQTVANAISAGFVPTRAEIKDRIDSLVERRFMKRGDRTGTYVYES